MRNALWITSAQRYSFGRFINERDQITKPQALAMPFTPIKMMMINIFWVAEFVVPIHILYTSMI